jgi:predicted O-methyltransferase YrrM
MLIAILTSSFLTAITVAVTLALVSRGQERRVMRRKARHFWNNQSVERLGFHTGLPSADAPPPRPSFFDHLRASTFAFELLKELVARDGLASLNYQIRGDAVDLATLLSITNLQARACVDLLSSVGLVKWDEHTAAFVFDPAARVYLSTDSPLCHPELLPGDAPLWAWRRRKALRPNPAAAAWATGRTVNADNAERWAIYMHQESFPMGFALHELALFPAASKILDVAAGAGSVCVALALKDSTLQLSLVELPGSVAFAERMVARYDLGGRIVCLGRNMFEDAWPEGYDAVIFTNIFHDWDDERCMELARRAYASLRSGGKVILQEALLGDGEPTPLKTLTIGYTMAIEFNSRQFSFAALRNLLTNAGFSSIVAHPLVAPYSAVVGIKE